MALPEGYEAHIVARSSTFKTWGILQANAMGVVDGSYCGDNDQWHMPVYATRDTVIEVNDRICQFRIMENQPRLTFLECDRLGGADGAGSAPRGGSEPRRRGRAFARRNEETFAAGNPTAFLFLGFSGNVWYTE